MTGPIAFTSTPFPLLPDVCDGVDAFSDTATTTDANFAKVNTYFGGRGSASTFMQAPMNYGNTNLNGTGEMVYSAAQWPALTFTVPTGCLGVLLALHVGITANDSTNTLVSVYPQITGAGLRVPIDARMLEVMATGAFFCGTRTLLITGVDLVVGGQVSLRPVLTWTGATGVGSTSVDRGSIQATILRGL